MDMSSSPRTSISASATNHHTTLSPKDVSGGGVSNNLSGGNRSHGYCLKWKYYHNNLLHMFNQLLLNESFTDVVVGCEGKIIKCHKMVLSACSKYFEQVFSEYPQQNSTLVVLKDYSYHDVQAIIEFMYQGEINVAHDRLQSLLKAAESLQVKGLADITSGGEGATSKAVNQSSSVSKDPPDENSGTDSNPASPFDINAESGTTVQEPTVKRKRGRPPLTPHAESGSMDGLVNLSSHQQMMGEEHQFDDFPVTNMLETHYQSPRPSKKLRTKITSSAGTGNRSSGLIIPELMDTNTNDENDDFEDEDVTTDDILNIVKMNDYIEKGGSRPQFWDEPTTKKIMNCIKNKKMEMKMAAEILGVSYSTLYSRYRELYGYLKMPANQDTNFNYYQVLNLLRAGQISLQDAAKRLSINERTLTSYLQSTITPKRPKNIKEPGTSSSTSDPKVYGLSENQHGTSISLTSTGMPTPEDLLQSLGDREPLDDYDDSGSDGSVKNLQLPATVKSEVNDGGWGR